jgi:hypothetical protein
VFKTQFVHIRQLFLINQSSRFIDIVQTVIKKQTNKQTNIASNSSEVFNNRSHLHFGSELLDSHQGLLQKCPDPMALD